MQRVFSRLPNGGWHARKNPPWVIFDEILGDYCALPQEGKALEFGSERAASAWLVECKYVWREWGTKDVRTPQLWWGFTPSENSPWQGFMTPPSDSRFG
jgi:hypothetical protein